MRCNECVFLDKKVRRDVCGCYQYGCRCKEREDKYISAWINGDDLLGQIGCDLGFGKGEGKQITLFEMGVVADG
ncbi:hypothetical protein [Enterocloster bolteae]|uniref:hypothetical protein n=1 Tax=Enterocloster bolteae TaxID=208479 RepID=UPI002A80D0C0|nr:hypothetical protein [Enterocloster bolteae]